ncbi:prolyl oligopeptidase family serine peptidase [Melioribacter sp. OK-6-Me]|uniref:prolyl oligopeptidase family serine peptidase n=1 Tax=unclassified Melioribacter TaxID=2627329 RepID=UPI003ED8D9EC
MKIKTSMLSFLLLSTSFYLAQGTNYPESKRIDHKDYYHGVVVDDPYRWLEDMESADTKKWVETQNKFTQDYLEKIPYREKLRTRLKELWNYKRYTTPFIVGNNLIYSKNDGLQEQNVYYIQKPGFNEEILLDPNKFSDDGSVSLTGLYFSKDHNYMSYGISRGGSDWREFYIMELNSKKIIDDTIKWAKFTGNAWYKNGFFYSRYDEPEKGKELKSVNEFHKLYYHKIGTPQSQDIFILSDSNPKRLLDAVVTDDEKYLVINVYEGSSSNNLLWFKNLEKDGTIVKLINEFNAEYEFLDAIDGQFYLLTNLNAPNKRIIKINPEGFDGKFETVISERNEPIKYASIIGNKIFVIYMKDASDVVKVYDIKGHYLQDIELPTIGSVYGFSGSKKDSITFFTFTSFTYPPTIYKVSTLSLKKEIFIESELDFNPENYTTKRIFYTSKDGTKVPMFIVHRNGIVMDGSNPTLLYAYGGFNIPMLPSFSVPNLVLLENGFIFAMACLRGGSEYGEEWHKAGMLEKKQNVFDDFIAAGEWLIKNKYTSSENLAIQGASNGGLLIGAVINQRPELFKVAIPMVGVMDMLRFHKFTIGWAWVSEYGSSDDPQQFKYLFKYSPLHNIKPGRKYPATIITTADHDDRVFPAHSFKYAAALQNANAGENPILIRIETQVGHGAGTSISKSIDLYTDLWSFLFYNLNVKPIYK